MADISPDYASPGLRMGLLIEDHPDAEVTYSTRLGTDLGIPADQGGDEMFVVATISGMVDPETGKPIPPKIGWKALSSRPTKRDGTATKLDHPSDQFNLNCTKAAGRALKRAGYPDDMVDLQALVVWRKRNAENRALLNGTATLELRPADPARALMAAAKTDPEAVSHDDGDAPTEEVEGAPTGFPRGRVIAEVSIESIAPSDETKAALRKAVNGLGKDSSLLTTWARQQGFRVTRPASEGEALALIAKAHEIAGGPAPADDEIPVEVPPGLEAEAAAASPAGEADDVVELIAGLDDQGAKNFAVFCKTIDVDPKMDWSKASDSVIAEVMAWLAVDF